MADQKQIEVMMEKILTGLIELVDARVEHVLSKNKPTEEKPAEEKPAEEVPSEEKPAEAGDDPSKPSRMDRALRLAKKTVRASTNQAETRKQLKGILGELGSETIADLDEAGLKKFIIRVKKLTAE